MTIDTIMNTHVSTREEVRRAFDITVAIAEAIRGAGEIESGVLYAVLCARLDLQGYESVIRTLKNAGLVSEDRSKLLKWVGPKVGA